MARLDDGEIFFESEGATEEQLRAGLIAARRHIVGCGANVFRTLAAAERDEQYMEQVLAWEVGEADDPKELSEADLELTYVAEAAWQAALEAAGTDRGRLGVVKEAERDHPAVVRDLFEAVS